MEMVDPEYDWMKANICHILWYKPELYIKFTRRSGVKVPPIDG